MYVYLCVKSFFNKLHVLVRILLLIGYHRLTTITKCTAHSYNLSITLILSELSGHIIMLIGNVCSKIVYFCLRKPITLSTWIRTRESWRAKSTSIFFNCFLPFVKGGTFTSAQYKPTVSCIVKPRSARIWSPGRSWFKIPQFSVRCWSETRPPHPFEMNVILPWGAIPIKNVITCHEFKQVPKLNVTMVMPPNLWLAYSSVEAIHSPQCIHILQSLALLYGHVYTNTGI